MLINYAAIVKEHREYYGIGNSHLDIYRDLYADKTHFIYELIQNAEDAASSQLSIRFQEDGIIVGNNGRPFNQQDVAAICSIGQSAKNRSQIGRFGIGFKAVYAYTDTPQILSGENRFQIVRFVEPQPIETLPRLVDVDHLEETNLFYLPFAQRVNADDKARLQQRIQELDPLTLLFLDNLNSIVWVDAIGGNHGSYERLSAPGNDSMGVRQVILRQMLSGEVRRQETFLVFDKRLVAPPTVMSGTLAGPEQIHLSNPNDSDTSQQVSIAVRLESDVVSPVTNAVLFSSLPVEAARTNLHFLIQGPYHTTPARDNISFDSALNQWLISETSDFLVEILRSLKEAGYLSPDMYDVMPLATDSIAAFYQPILEAVEDALRHDELIPTEDDTYANPSQVFYPEASELRWLLTRSDLSEMMEIDSAHWLHIDIRDTAGLRRRFEVVKQAGVHRVTAQTFVHWLHLKGKDWFQRQSDEWIQALYRYLSRQESLWEDLHNIPILRIQNGTHYVGSEGPVFFSPSEDAAQELQPLLEHIPVLRQGLVTDSGSGQMRDLLTTIGVKPLDPRSVVMDWLVHQYSVDGAGPSIDENRAHLRYLLRVLSDMPTSRQKEVADALRVTPLLLAYRPQKPEERQYRQPNHLYIPSAFSENENLERYFAFAESDEAWFVEPRYLDEDDDLDEWLTFLKTIGCHITPRMLLRPLTEERKHELASTLIRQDNNPKDVSLHGLEQFLERDPEYPASMALWYLLRELPQAAFYRDFYWQEDRRRRRHWQYTKQFETQACCLLKAHRWLPDEQGNFQMPADLFAPRDDIRNVLGTSVSYLGTDFDTLESTRSRTLATSLGIKTSATTDSVLNYLRSLSGRLDIEPEALVSIYSFLQRQGAQRQEEFAETELIFATSPDAAWRQASEVFWEDEEAVFGHSRGYLVQTYPSSLKAFFIAQGVTERASPLDYVQAVRDIAGTLREGTSDTHNLLHPLYRRLSLAIEEGGDWQQHALWQEVKDGPYWLGHVGTLWRFVRRSDLVWNDHPYLQTLFSSFVPFWQFAKLTALTKHLEIEGCSTFIRHFHRSGEGETDDAWSRTLRALGRDVQAFLTSPALSTTLEHIPSPTQLADFMVRLTEYVSVTYELKGQVIPNPDRCLSYLDAEHKTLWLSREAQKEDYPELIGDALETHFGTPQLREFVKDLLIGNRDAVIRRWERRGLQVPEESTEAETHRDHRPSEPSPDQNGMPRDYEDGLSTGEGVTSDNRWAAPGNTEDGEQPEHDPSGRRLDQSARTVGRSHYGGGGEESQAHLQLKHFIARKPEVLEEGLQLRHLEYSFPSGDRVDVLLEDKDGRPVAVEVETDAAGTEVGLWQAIKYQHLIAVRARFKECSHARGFLVAPFIPEKVKQLCVHYGIEFREISPE